MTQPQTDQPTEEDIIALAYAMAVGFDRYYELFDALSARLASHEKWDQTEEDRTIETLSRLEPHFHNALDLMHKSALQREKPKHTVRAMEDDLRPSILVTPNGRITYANASATDKFGWASGDRLDAMQFEPEQFKGLTHALTGLADTKTFQLVGTFEVFKSDGSGPIRVSLRKVLGDQNEVLGHISALSSSWHPDLAAEFKAVMKITPAELDVVRAVVTGLSLTDLALERGRAVGTVRLQAKTLLKKLHLRSQTELACLYASFAELRVTPSHEGHAGQTSPAHSRMLRLSDGRQLEYEIAGPPDGRPVLYFPALLGGAAFTERMHRSLYQQKICLITVWRPGFASSDPDGPPTFAAFENHAMDVLELLAELNIKTCVVIGHITSVMFAYALAKYAPDTVRKVVAVNGTVPSWSGKHVSKLDKAERIRFALLRRAPKIGRMIVHTLLAKVEAGFDDEFLSTFLSSNFDKNTLQHPEIRTLFREALSKTIAQGYDTFVHELSLGALEWEPLVQGVQCPIEVLIGEENVVYTPTLVSEYAMEHPDMKIEVIPDTGHLLLFQNFERVLKATVEAPHAMSLVS